MSKLPDLQEGQAVAGGQALRLPGGSRDAVLHEQLYRYAEDLRQMMERQSALENDNQMLRDVCGRLGATRDVFDQLVDRSPDLHVITDDEGQILQGNAAASRLAPLAQLTGSSLRYWVLPSHRDNFDALRRRALSGADSGEEWELRLRSDAIDKPQLIVTAHAISVLREGRPNCLHWILRDVTRLREVQFESQISSMVFNSAAEAVMITDVEGEILAVNPAFTRITGYGQEEALGRHPNMLRSGMHDAGFYAEFWQTLREKGTWQGEIYNRKKSGEVYPGWLTVNAACDGDGHVLSYVAVFTDLSRILRTEKRLAYLAHHDMLTGLPNRLLFQDRLTQTTGGARRSGSPFTLIFIDLDRFKQINDTIGHEVGDRVLQVAAKRLSAAIREVDTVARLGGDEFVVIAPGLAGAADIGQVCEKILTALGRSITVDEHELFIGGSLGCATYPLHGDDEATLLKHADVAMYKAKAAGGNTFFIHDAGSAVDNGAVHFETEFRRALERGQLRLEFQPQVASDDGSLLGVEALLRWDHPVLGSVPPAQFIPVAEQTGTIIAIGAWVIEAACRQLSEWDAQGLPELSMAVNLSPRQLRDPGIVECVSAALEASGVAAERLELEVTESEVMFHLEGDHGKLSALRELGVKVAIDDFGTGYSSLARLMHLPIDSLKLDRSFIVNLEQEGNSRAAAITAAIVTMGRALGVDLVAEGVETDAQYEMLSRQGCQVIQGYLTGRPMRPEKLVQWLAERGAARTRPASE